MCGVAASLPIYTGTKTYASRIKINIAYKCVMIVIK